MEIAFFTWLGLMFVMVVGYGISLIVRANRVAEQLYKQEQADREEWLRRLEASRNQAPVWITGGNKMAEKKKETNKPAPKKSNTGSQYGHRTDTSEGIYGTYTFESDSASYGSDSSSSDSGSSSSCD